MMILWDGPYGSSSGGNVAATIIAIVIAGSASEIRGILLSFVTIVVIAAIIAITKVMSGERKRAESNKRFLIECQSRMEKPSVPTELVAAHIALRSQLFKKHNEGGLEAMRVADKVIAENEDYSKSWQRKLSEEEKNALKSVLVQRCAATLQIMELRKKDYEAKAALYERQLIADEQWQNIQKDFEQICRDLQFLILEANCIEQNFAEGPNGMIRTATGILRAQIQMRQQQIIQQQKNIGNDNN